MPRKVIILLVFILLCLMVGSTILLHQTARLAV
jgi:hypothetical protein